jgi:hypothetical protein
MDGVAASLWSTLGGCQQLGLLLAVQPGAGVGLLLLGLLCGHTLLMWRLVALLGRLSTQLGAALPPGQLGNRST